MDIYVGFDTSLRSTGCVAIDQDGDVLSCMLIQPTGKDTAALRAIHEQTTGWLEVIKGLGQIKRVGIEMIAIGGRSGSKEKLAAVKWAVHTVAEAYHDLEVDVCAVNSWRAKVITKDIRAAIKSDPARFIKGWEKIEVQKLLPDQPRHAFGEYLSKRDSDHGWADLSDAFFIANYYRTIG